jgi:hypothetical protein
VCISVGGGGGGGLTANVCDLTDIEADDLIGDCVTGLGDFNGEFKVIVAGDLGICLLGGVLYLGALGIRLLRGLGVPGCGILEIMVLGEDIDDIVEAGDNGNLD